MQNQNYPEAIACFEKAEISITIGDHNRINTELGKALYRHAIATGRKEDSSFACYTLLEKSRERLESAVASNPGNYAAAYHLAATLGLMERLHVRLYPDKKNPCRAGSAYETAIAMRPFGITVHYAYAGYLAAAGECPNTGERLKTTLEKTVAIYPRAYFYLKLGYQVFMKGPIKSLQRLPVRNIENLRRSDFFPARR